MVKNLLNKNEYVPDKKIAMFLDEDTFSEERLEELFSKPEKKRAWFTPYFYNCLPLVIGNQYGFVIKTEHSFEVEWDGGSSTDSLKIYSSEVTEGLHPVLQSHFGEGILTLQLPFVLRTPPGVNLMTINPPNYVLPGITVMTGVVETDNLRRAFTANLKLNIAGLRIKIEKGAWLCGVLPIPRYYGDKFDLIRASEVFSEELVGEELKAFNDAKDQRKMLKEQDINQGLDRDYFRGQDVYGNRFKDHQTK